MESRMKIYYCLVLICLSRVVAESPHVYDAIVVGLGASGLGALSRLAERGHRVLGLESKGRLGGRVNTQDFGGGLVEFGAEWIHGENVVYAIARQNNVSIQYTTSWPYFIRTANLNETFLADVLSRLYTLYEEGAVPQNLTVGQFLTERFYQFVKDEPDFTSDNQTGRNILRLLELELSTADASDSWHDISGKGLGEYEESTGSQEWSWHRFGYRTLFDILLHKYNNGSGLPVDIRLNTKVTQIDWTGDGTVVVTAGGETYRAKAVIATVSLGVLKDSHTALFEPSLPIEKARAIAALSFGVVDKICLYYEDIWWGEQKWILFLWTNEERSRFPAEDWWLQEIGSFSVPTSNDHVLELWISGAAARHMETLDVALVKRKTKELLEFFFRDSNVTVPDAKDIGRSTWYSDPDVRGSYSFHGLVSDAIPTAVAELAFPLPSAANPRLLFAGEATNPRNFSTVHGALQSGWREADRFHEMYRDKTA